MPSATGGSSSGRARQSSRVTAADGKARLDLELHPLNLIRLDELVPAVIELSGPGRGVAGDRRGALKRAAVEEVVGDPGRPAGVAADVLAEPGRSGAALDDAKGGARGEGPPGELAAPAGEGLEERSRRGRPEPGSFEIGVEGLGRPAVHRHPPVLPALLVEREIRPPALVLVVADRRATAAPTREKL